MRQIKFRAWIDNEMLSHEQLIDMDQETHAMYTIITKPEQIEELVFMQYTGLKDSNGVDVYEGDIVRYTDGIGWISYQNEIATFQVETNNWCITIPHLFAEADDQWLEVIGNIYENKELINS